VTVPEAGRIVIDSVFRLAVLLQLANTTIPGAIMGQLIRSLLTSKKFVTALAGTIAAALLKYGWDVSSETVLAVLSPLISYILSQGVADIGKYA